MAESLNSIEGVLVANLGERSQEDYRLLKLVIEKVCELVKIPERVRLHAMKGPVDFFVHDGREVAVTASPGEYKAVTVTMDAGTVAQALATGIQRELDAAVANSGPNDVVYYCPYFVGFFNSARSSWRVRSDTKVCPLKWPTKPRMDLNKLRAGAVALSEGPDSVLERYTPILFQASGDDRYRVSRRWEKLGRSQYPPTIVETVETAVHYRKATEEEEKHAIALKSPSDAISSSVVLDPKYRIVSWMLLRPDDFELEPHFFVREDAQPEWRALPPIPPSTALELKPLPLEESNPLDVLGLKWLVRKQQLPHWDTVRWLVSDEEQARRSGRTHMLALAFIEYADANIHKTVHLWDHHDNGHAVVDCIYELLKLLSRFSEQWAKKRFSLNHTNHTLRRDA